MAEYQQEIRMAEQIKQANGSGWHAVSPEHAARMRLQNRFKTGLDIAKYTAAIMRRDMAAYDADPAQYTQSLGCWHGFVAQQKMIAVKNTTSPPPNAISTSPAGWWPRCARSSARCPTSPCTKKPPCPT